MVDIIPGPGGAGPNILETALGAMPQASIEPFEGLPGVVSIRETTNGKMRFEDLERFARAPRRTRQRVQLENVEAFVRYVSEFARPSRTLVFATAHLSDYAIRAMIDYHGTGEDEASWQEHSATYSPAFATGFGAWNAIHGQPITQAQFADFLEDRAADAVVPDPADLMAVASHFEAVRDVTFKSAINVSTGERQFRYEEKDGAGGGIQCPKMILLRTPIFEGTPPIDFSVRISYTFRDGKLVFALKIHRMAETIDEAFNALCDEIRQGLGDGIPVYRGFANI